MKAKHYILLEEAIEAAVEKISEYGNPGLVYDTLHEDMARAAELVYDASMRAQDFAEREGA